MSEPSPKPPSSNAQILLFIIILCFVCGLLLAVVSFSLSKPQEEAKTFDQSKQMLIAAKVINYSGQFQLLDKDGKLVPAIWDADKKMLEAAKKGEEVPKAQDDAIKQVAKLRIRPLLTDAKGEVFSFEQKGVNLQEYLTKNKKQGYANLPLKLFYAILPNAEDAGKITAEDVAKDLTKAELFVIPINGFGLWDAIYGYLAIEKNGDTVVGTTWYQMAETPGLGANITEAWWQKPFFGKLIFQEGDSGKTDFKTAPLGIIVVKGKVSDVLGDSPKAKSAVDGMSGATLTGDGVTAAYKSSLTPYRQFFIKLHKQSSGEKNGETAS